jgi:hypothetical protein
MPKANLVKGTGHRAKPTRKPKFQADLAPFEDSAVRSLKQQLQLTSNSDFFSEAVALFQWAVSERRQGHRIVSESANGEKKILVLPRLERVAPESALPGADRLDRKRVGTPGGTVEFRAS